MSDMDHFRLHAVIELYSSNARQATRTASCERSSSLPTCPVGELRERAAELAFEASDVGAVADALEPLQHQCRVLAVLPNLFDWRLNERNRSTQRLRQDLRRLRHRSYVTGEIDLAAVQGRGVGERARAEPADVVARQSSAASWPVRAPRTACRPGDCTAPEGSP